MKIRFRKSVKIAPGIRVNFSKSGVSTSIGPRGAKVNFSKRGTRVTTGIPGTGFTASKLYRNNSRRQRSSPTRKEEWIAALLFIAIISGVIAIGSEGIRPLALTICFSCIAILIFLVRNKKTAPTQQISAIQSTTPVSQAPTWQERVASIEGSRDAPQAPSPPSALMLDQPINFVDHLGDAAEARSKARNAEKTGNLDEAWKYLQEEKRHFLLHATRQGFTFEQTLSLDASVSEKMANILRKQKRHNDAFVHIVYWVSAQRNRPLKRHAEKFRSYYNRADEMNISADDAWSVIMTAPIMDFAKVQMMVRQWMKQDS